MTQVTKNDNDYDNIKSDESDLLTPDNEHNANKRIVQRSLEMVSTWSGGTLQSGRGQKK